jgi:hypothetical protein
MLGTAWKDYRGWAAAARALQRSARKQTLWALVLACAAALLGALAAALGPPAGTLRTGASVLAAVCAGLAPVLGRHVLDANAQGRWIQARAVAEAIQSECYRYAARAGEYGEVSAARRFEARVSALARTAQEKGVVPDVQARETADKPPPPADMTAAWYRDNRLAVQRVWFARRSTEHVAAAQRVRITSLALALAAAALGVLSASELVSWVAPFVAAVTTVGASVAALGLVDRHQFLATSFAGMAQQIDRLEALHREQALSDAELIPAGEDLLSSEHRAWADRMAQLRVPPPPSAPSPQANRPKEDPAN